MEGHSLDLLHLLRHVRHRALTDGLCDPSSVPSRMLVLR